MIEQLAEPLGPQGRLFEQELHQDLHQFLAGTLFCGGVNDAREILCIGKATNGRAEGNPKLQETFELGKSIC